MATETFYSELPSFTEFDGVTNEDNYYPLPDEWEILITDVVNSTDAIENGQYRDVNKIGAGSVSTVQNVLEDLEFPFVFEGDGAKLSIPSHEINEVKPNLAGLQKLAQENFGLDLRVGSLSVAQLREDGYTLDVAKMKLAADRSISMFRGGGLRSADDKIKNQREKYEIQASTVSVKTGLDSLSCRWQPIPSGRGKILTILVETRSEGTNTYSDILNEFDAILEGGINQANPINQPQMSYKSVIGCIRDEIRYEPTIFSMSFIGRLFQILLAVSVFKFGLHPLFFDPEKYANSLRAHSDYRKYADTLHMVIDCAPEESDGIRSYLDDLYSDEQIFYGIHESDQSVMTCYVNTLDDGGHIHFLDGENGGYTRAAQMLKSQIKSSENNKRS